MHVNLIIKEKPQQTRFCGPFTTVVLNLEPIKTRFLRWTNCNSFLYNILYTLLSYCIENAYNHSVIYNKIALFMNLCIHILWRWNLKTWSVLTWHYVELLKHTSKYFYTFDYEIIIICRVRIIRHYSALTWNWRLIDFGPF